MSKAKTNQGDEPLRETEAAAYHAYREWPVLLVLRQKELLAHQLDTPPVDRPATVPLPKVPVPTGA